MQLIFLGTGSSFIVDKSNFHSNMLLKADSGEMLLIDCGSDARRSLHALGLSYRDIKNVYVSHAHADHAGGLEWLAFARKFDVLQLSKPNLFLSETMVDSLWEHTLSGGLTSLSNEPATLSAYFQVHPVPINGSFVWQGITFQVIQNLHVCSPYANMPSFGLYFSVGSRTVYITTDAQFNPSHMLTYYLNSDLIFHDCETTAIPSKVHAHYEELKTLDSNIKAKMWLYHCDRTFSFAKADGFAGFVRRGQCFNL